jgi:hypothetical protein
MDIIIDRFPVLKDRLLTVGGAVRVKLERALQVNLFLVCVASPLKLLSLLRIFCS